MDFFCNTTLDKIESLADNKIKRFEFRHYQYDFYFSSSSKLPIKKNACDGVIDLRHSDASHLSRLFYGSSDYNECIRFGKIYDKWKQTQA